MGDLWLNKYDFFDKKDDFFVEMFAFCLIKCKYQVKTVYSPIER